MRKKSTDLFNSISNTNTRATFVNKLPNPIEINPDYSKMYVKYKDITIECYIDTADIPKVCLNKTWIGAINGSGDKIYVVCSNKGKRVSLHRLLTNCPDNMVVDHINGNTYDNRQANLRVCTPGVNMLNKKKYNNNTTGITGINEFKGVYKLNISRQFNNFDYAAKAKEEIQQIIDYYSNLDASERSAI